ncbi:LysR family transcriptional regulator [Pseudorhodobacter ferrugineus]|uniref:LysR family transcriptional regulator n=1 Tax=Pseudorhodobacter ferrugineus TaxID=77008 RepID=UPI0003B734EB|nr:LysR family transcriptional regulator [Pseudorhodobacter ferrugineus]
MQIYLSVYNSGSMTVAAQEFRQTQSAVSRHIARIEADLGVKLFERQSRPLVPTSAGRQLAKLAGQFIAQAALFRSEFGNLGVRIQSHLRLGVVDSLADPLVPELIKSTRHLVDTVSVMAGHVEPLRTKFVKRELDAIISPDPLDDLDGFDRHEILFEKFVVLAPRGTIPFVDEETFRHFTSTIPMIRSTASTSIAQRIEQHFRRMRLIVPQGSSCDTIDSIVNFVAADLGWSILTPTCLRKCINHMPFIQVLPLPGPGFSRRVYLVTRSEELKPLKLRLSDACRDIFSSKYLPALHAIAPWLAEETTISANSTK